MHPSHNKNQSLTKTSKLIHTQTQGNRNGKTSECYAVKKKCESACDTTSLKTYTNNEVKKSKMVTNKTANDSTDHKVRSDCCVRFSDCNKREYKPVSDRTAVCNSKCKEQNTKLAFSADKKNVDTSASKVKTPKKVWNAGASNGAKPKGVLDKSVAKGKAQKTADMTGKITERMDKLHMIVSEGEEQDLPADTTSEEHMEQQYTCNIQVARKGKTYKIVLDADSYSTATPVDECVADISDYVDCKTILSAEVSEDTDSKIVLTADESEDTVLQTVLIAGVSEVTSSETVMCVEESEDTLSQTVLRAEVSEDTMSKTVLTAEESENKASQTVLSAEVSEDKMPNLVFDDDVDCQETDNATLTAYECEMLVAEQVGLPVVSASENELANHSEAIPTWPDNVKPGSKFLKEAMTLTRIHMMCTQIKLAIQDWESKKRLSSGREKKAPVFNYGNVPAQYVPRLLASRRRVRFTREGELVPAHAGCDDSSFETFEEMLEAQKMEAKQRRET